MTASPMQLTGLWPLLMLLAIPARADIYQWEYVDPLDPSLGKQQSATLAPGGAGVDAVPGADLRFKDLTKAFLIGLDLHETSFLRATLTDADLSQADLTDADLSRATLSAANLIGAKVRGANFSSTTEYGFTVAQIYSTASYQAHDLAGISLHNNDLAGADFTAQNLKGAGFSGAKLTDVDFSHANLTNTGFHFAVLANANLTGTKVQGANFLRTTEGGFTATQLYSTDSYHTCDLTGIHLGGNDLSGWNFSGQDLTDSTFSEAVVTGVNFAGAIIKGADFGFTTAKGLSADQLYATASYQSHDMASIRLHGNDLSGWNLAHQNLSNAYFTRTSLAGANLTGADLRRAELPIHSIHLDFIGTNLIRPDGRIAGLNLSEGEHLKVRDYDGDAIKNWPPLSIRVDDHFQITSTGTLRMIFEADPWDSTISFEPDIPVTLGGTLALTFAADVDLATQVGRTLKLFDWTGVSPTGSFAVWSPHLWDTSGLYTTGEVTFLAVADPSLVPGDYNGDGMVDTADYIVWRNHLGAPAGTLPNDVDGEPIGIAQYATWKANYGNIALIPIEVTAVPEPTTILSLLAGLFFSTFLRPRAIF